MYVPGADLRPGTYFFYTIGNFIFYRIKKYYYTYSHAAKLSLARPRSMRSVRIGAHYFVRLYAHFFGH